MDNTVIETKRQVSDAGNPLQFMWVSLTAIHHQRYGRVPILSIWPYRSESGGKLPDRPAPER